MGELRWGVFGTGYVARKFALGLRASPGAEIVAVASRSRERAKDFASGVGATAAATSYEDMITLDSVDAIYIATPAHLHRDHAILCLNAGKPALIEKPMALDASQAREIVAASRANNSFCMEAMWTRFTPLVREVKRRVTAGELGQLRLLTGSFCTAEHVDASRHLFNPGMGGGALLDRAVYPISLAVHFMGVPDTVTGQIQMGKTGVDEQAAITLGWQGQCLGQFQASLVSDRDNDFELTGSRARLRIAPPLYRPCRLQQYAVTPGAKPTNPVPSRKDAFKESHWLHRVYQRVTPQLTLLPGRGGKTGYYPYSSNAYHHQAEEVAACIANAKVESDIMPLTESIAVLEIIDALRNTKTD